MNYGTLVKGAFALSLSLIVASASAATTTYDDVQKYGAMFETTVNAPVGAFNDYNYEVGSNVTAYADATTGVGWFSGDAESDESKIIERTDAAGGQALQLNTDASTLTNKFASGVATDLNDGIAANGAYFETEVKFVPSDTLDAGIEGGADATKFAIYAYANEEVEPPVTNLVVFHGVMNAAGVITYTNEVFSSVNIDANEYASLRIEMKQLEDPENVGDIYNVFSVSINGAAALTSDLALDKLFDANASGTFFLTVENRGNDDNALVSSLNFKGTGEIDNIKAGVIEGTTSYAINWTAENATVTNAAGTVLTSTDTNFTAGATLTFTPATDMVITNVLVDGAVVAFDPASYTYTVGAADATVAVYAGSQSVNEFSAGDNVDGLITADQAAWLNSYIGTYTYEQLAALTGWQDKYLLNVDPFNGAGTLTVTAITVGNDVQVSIALARTEDGTAISGNRAIKGVLKLYGTADLGTNFAVLSTATVTDDDFSEGDTTTAAFSGGTAKFFKAVIEAPVAQ